MSQRVSDQPAFLLHRRDFQDSSLILDLFTRQFGRISLVARGARKRRDAASFQPFNRLQLSWSGRAEMKTLVQIEAQSLNLDHSCYLPCYYVNELLLYLLPKYDEHSTLYTAYEQFLQQVNSTNVEPLLRQFEIRLLTDLGLLPDLACCSENGQGLQPDAYYRMDVEQGILPAGTPSASCFSGAELLAISRQEFFSREVLGAAKRLCRQIIDFNLQGRALQSRKLYQQLHSHR